MAIAKYLSRYAAPEANLLADFSGSYEHVLCIPAFAEAANFLSATVAAVSNPNVLVILVINASGNGNPEQLDATRAIATHLKRQYSTRRRLAENMTLLDGAGGADILLVERCTPGYYLGEKEGVGMARKIACDIACRLITDKCINSAWIHTTDADCILPSDYFRAVDEVDAAHTSAALYPFIHVPHQDEAIRQAQQLYDFSLYYYVAGLAWAGSSWAFHTIGSTLAISAVHYAKVRGFPVRTAGEDFYLLNKLAKTGEINPLQCTPLRLETRVSGRVPFGTGPALQKIMLMSDPLSEFLCYHPDCFVYLKCWLSLQHTLWRETAVLPDENSMAGFCTGKPEFSDIDPAILAECLAALGVAGALEHARSHSRSEKVFLGHLRNWFDAFMTLKFIHWLRDHRYPSVTLKVIQEDTGLPFAADLEGHAPAQRAWNRPPLSPHPGRPAR